MAKPSVRRSFEVAAPLEGAWHRLAEVERWPEWAPHIVRWRSRHRESSDRHPAARSGSRGWGATRSACRRGSRTGGSGSAAYPGCGSPTRPAAGWSKVPVRFPWDLARSRTGSRRFRERSGRVRWSRRARRLVTASLRGRPPPVPATPACAPAVGRDSCSPPIQAPPHSTMPFGVLTASWARRTPDETPSRTGPCRSLACGPVRRLDLPPDHFVFRHSVPLQFEGAGQREGSGPAGTAAPSPPLSPRPCSPRRTPPRPYAARLRAGRTDQPNGRERVGEASVRILVSAVDPIGRVGIVLVSALWNQVHVVVGDVEHVQAALVGRVCVIDLASFLEEDADPWRLRSGPPDRAVVVLDPTRLQFVGVNETPVA